MGYNYDYWKKRMMSRSDMSTYLTHLTRPTDTMAPLDVLRKILHEKKIVGSNSTGFIQGSDRAVCFQDAPPTGIAQNVYHEQQLALDKKIEEMRYYSFGLMFTKKYAFNKGARPVIYETKEKAQQFYNRELWRVVTFDLSDDTNIIDWTHEREWRVKGDFDFELEEVIVILPNDDQYREFIKKVDGEIIKKLNGIINMRPIIM